MIKTHWRAHRRAQGALVINLALILAACGGPAPSGLASTGRGESPGVSEGSARPILTPSPMKNATAAAAAVLEAKDDDSRKVAILSVLQAVGIGVYGSDGTPIVRGAERSESDFWVYDFEVDALAAAVKAGDRVPLGEIVSSLAAAGADDGGRSYSEAQVATAVRAGAAEAVAHPDDITSTALEIARALALKAEPSIDLAAPSQEPIVLDALATFLIAADIILPSVAAEAPPSATLIGAIANADPRALPGPMAAGGCGQITNANTVNAWGSGQAAVQLLQGGIKAGMPGSKMLHAILLNAAVEARVQANDVHYRHSATQTPPEKVIVTYFLRIQPGQQAIACGLFAAIVIGAQGPLVDLPVTWETAALARHGNPVCPSAYCQTTITDGSSTLLFEPKTEAQPAEIGPEFHEQVLITATANVLQGLGPDLFLRLGGVSPVKAVPVNIDVGYHRPYEVWIDVDSSLAIHPTATLAGVLTNRIIAISSLTGTLKGRNVHALGSTPLFDSFPGDLTITTKPPAGREGTCNTFTANSNGPKVVFWAVRDAVLWPPQEITVSLYDWGTQSLPNQNLVDRTWTRLCTPQGGIIVDDRDKPAQLWENAMFQSHPVSTGVQGGLEFAGLGKGHWDYRADLTTWEHGGTVAFWESEETCDGVCTGSMKLTLRVTPLPFP